MGNAGNGVAQHALLTQHDQEEFADAIFNMVAAVLWPGFGQQGN